VLRPLPVGQLLQGNWFRWRLHVAVKFASSGQQTVSIVFRHPFLNAHRGIVIALSERHRLPAIFGFRRYVMEGALISYGPDAVDVVRRSASYVDRILRGEKPADLPVQAPTKYELAINLKTAKALGIEIPPTLLARADEVIE
jgi:ABC-type uncharacterized transport system substrate-binding protein